MAETTCQLCGTAVRVEFKGGKVFDASHPEARVWDAQRREGRGTAGPPHCALMNLFCSAEHLAEWRYQNGMAPVRELDDRGHLVGSGTGRVEGPRINGTMPWSNFEQVFANHCRLNVAGTIETDDGAEIRFDSQGFALPPSGAGARAWTVASAVRFAAADGRYRWPEKAPAVWEGEFDPTTATARYRAYFAWPGNDGV